MLNRPATTTGSSTVPGPRTVPNLAVGWYVALTSPSLTSKPRRVDLFGRQFVAWRDSDGSPVLMSGHCPHMGAALYEGRVVDGTLECPFHRWKFSSDGNCVGIPSGGRIPPRARTVSLPTEERHGYVWVWYGSPQPLYSLPRMPLKEKGEPTFRLFRIADTTRTTVRRILENAYDPDHLVALHGLTVRGDATATELDESESAGVFGAAEIPGSRYCVRLSWPAYTGWLGKVSTPLGLNARRFDLLVEGWPTCQYFVYLADGVVQYRLLLATTPIAQDRTVQHLAVAIHQSGRRFGDALRYLLHRGEVTVAARQDLPIFNTIRPGDHHGIYVPTDRALRVFRKFYQRWVEADSARQ